MRGLASESESWLTGSVQVGRRQRQTRQNSPSLADHVAASVRERRACQVPALLPGPAQPQAQAVAVTATLLEAAQLQSTCGNQLKRGGPLMAWRAVKMHSLLVHPCMAAVARQQIGHVTAASGEVAGQLRAAVHHLRMGPMVYLRGAGLVMGHDLQAHLQAKKAAEKAKFDALGVSPDTWHHPCNVTKLQGLTEPEQGCAAA